MSVPFARCFNWGSRQNIDNLVVNPILMLPKNYAHYSVVDVVLAQKTNIGYARQVDDERDRRIEPGEEERIRITLDRTIRVGRERPMELKYQAALEAIFNIALESAMRMREIFTLTLDQVNFEKRTFFLDKTKNGHKRQVPMSSTVQKYLREYMQHVKDGTRGMEDFNFQDGRLLPWAKNSPQRHSLATTSSRLSNQFSRIFEYSGCPDLRFHDLRHEATSRLFERTKMSEFEIMKITGHSSTGMLRRYSNLRGSDLAEKMW